MEQMISKMPIPANTSYVLIDMGQSQILIENGSITGLVYTEAYAIAPRELDFIALEYVLDRRLAELISEGYEIVLPVPDLKPVRTVYQ